jgi:hypothetical protein
MVGLAANAKSIAAVETGCRAVIWSIFRRSGNRFAAETTITRQQLERIPIPPERKFALETLPCQCQADLLLTGAVGDLVRA